MDLLEFLKIVIECSLSMIFLIFIIISFVYFIITLIKMNNYKSKSIKGKTIIVVKASLKFDEADESLVLSLLKRKGEVIFGFSDDSIKNRIYSSLNKNERKLCKFIKLNLLNLNSIINFCQQVKNQCCKIDILINNFDYKFKTISEMIENISRIDKIHKNIYEGFILLTLLLFDHFNKKGGRIINTSSILHEYAKDYYNFIKIDEGCFSKFLNQLCEQNFPYIKSAYTFSERNDLFPKKEEDYYFIFLKENNFRFGYKYLYPIIANFKIIIDKSQLPLNLCYITLKELSHYNDNASKYNYCNNDNNIDNSIKINDSIELIIEKIKKRIPQFYKLDFLDNFLNDRNKIKFNTYFEYKSNKELNNQINLCEHNKKLIKELIKEKRSLKLFDPNFISKNRDKCKLIINGEEFELFEKINYKFFLEIEELEIKIKQIKPITDMSFMFAYSDSLAFITDISNLDTSKVTNMESMFVSCKYIPDISNWDTSKVTNMQSMFSYCKYVPDISKCNTSKVKNMSNLFSSSNS